MPQKKEMNNMFMVQVIDRKIASYNLPKVGILKDGRTVSGYHLLDEEILKQEGLATFRR